ncbi:Integrase/recombinase xerD [Mycena sanguinolenta]|uniref:Integrase/recombinase xerD n=1 Tax=Mycena sanguinolenta TaxID=230812 RepID=A0A8H7CRA5_9AGAR|nr:Integrase/recombinase xerD [Mycena sanguinolenta]
MSSPFVRITTAGRQRSKHFAQCVPPSSMPLTSPATFCSRFTRVSSSGRQRSKRFAYCAELRPRPLLIRESDAPETPSTFTSLGAPTPRSISAPAPSPLLLSNESAAHRFSSLPHSVLFPAFGLPNLRPNTDPRANSAPVSQPSSTPSVSTPLRRDAWEFCLRDYPGRSFVDSLLQIINHGCNIGFTGPRDISPTCTNLRSAFEHPKAVTDSITTQLSAGRLAGPYTDPPFPNTRISPLGVAIRKRSGKLRQIHHLSWPHGSSVNNGIADSEASIIYDMLAKSIDDLCASGPGSLMIKFDLEAAFRHIPIRLADVPLLGYSWRDSIYFELFLMFGLRSAPVHIQPLRRSTAWILQHHIPSWLRHYLDDFLLIFSPSTPPWIAHAALTWLRGLVRFLGLSLQDKKTEGPSTCLEMLGIELDSIAMEARLPAEKLAYLSEVLHVWRGKTHCSLRELQEFTGYLIFCSQVIPHSRAFLQSLFDFAASFKSSYSRRRLSHAARRDISWWSDFAATWNGVHVISPDRRVVDIYTDASGTKGAGGICGSHWFAIRIPWRYSTRDIKFKELFAVVHALLCWGPQLSGLHVNFHIDNTNMFHALENLSIRSAPTMQLLRQFLFLCARLDITFTPLWIRSEDNPLADAASRFEFARLFKLAPYLPPKPSRKILSLSLHATPDPSMSRPSL